MGEPTNGAPAIVVDDLRKVFRVGFAQNRQVEALRGVSFSVGRGVTFGFLGPNGAGKTTTIKTIIGLIFPTSGRVEVLGAPPDDAAVRRNVGYLPENPSFPDHLTGREVVELSCNLVQMPRARRQQRTAEVLELVKIAHAADLPVRRYSKGMTQRLGIAQALVHEPQLVILDEPMSGLDPIGRRDVKDLILRLRQAGNTVFFSTHIIADVEEICDEVAIVVGGRAVRFGRVVDLIGGEGREYEIIATGVPGDFPALGGQVNNGAVHFPAPSEDAARQLIEQLWSRGARVMSLRTRRYGLETIFLEEVAKQPALKRAEE